MDHQDYEVLGRKRGKFNPQIYLNKKVYEIDNAQLKQMQQMDLNLNYPNLISTLDSDELPIFDDILDDLVSNFDKDDQISAIKLQELPDNKPFQSKFNDQISSQPIEKNFQIHNHLRNFYTGFKRFLIKQYKGNEYSLKLEQFFSNKKKNQQNIPKNHFFFLLNQFKIINDKADFDSLLQNQKSYFDQSKQEHINFREFQVLQHYHNNLIKNKEDYNCIVKYVNEKNKENSQYLKEYCQFYHMQKVMLFGYKSKQGRQNNNHKKQKRIKKYREEQILINTFLLIAAENPKIL